MVSRVHASDLVVFYPDAGSYLTPAENWLREGWFADSAGRPMVDRTPGYPAFVALLMSIFGNDLQRVLIAQAILLSLTPVVLYGLALRVVAPEAALIAGMLAAVSPWSAVLAVAPLSDGLYLLALAIVFLGMKLTCESRNPNVSAVLAALTGVCTGAAILVRPLWPLLIVMPAGLFVCGFYRRDRWLICALTFLFAATPVVLWKHRNEAVAQFNGLTDITGKTAWRYLAARVQAEASGGNRHALSAAAYEDRRWQMSLQAADDEHWKRATAVFRAHPFLTVYSFFRSAAEHTVHPSPDVLIPARWSFRGDTIVLAIVWGTLLILSIFGLFLISDANHEAGLIARNWLFTFFMIASFLTLLSGISFAGGSRLRAPMELVVPLTASVALARGSRTRALQSSRFSEEGNS